MKKTYKTMFALMTGIMVLTSCSETEGIIENVNEPQQAAQLKSMTFTANMENEGDTKAAIDGTLIKWTAGDEISIFDGTNDNQFTLDGEGGSTSGSFTGTAGSAETYYAIYPFTPAPSSRTATEEDAVAAAGSYSNNLECWKMYFDCDMEDELYEDMTDYGISAENQAIIIAYFKGQDFSIPGSTLDGSSITHVELPAFQTVAEGQYVDPKAVLMMAKSTDAATLEFKNVCAYLKVTPRFDCCRITFSNDGTEELAGTLTVDYNNGVPTTTVTANGKKEVSLCGSIKGGNTYYIAVRPEALTSGFSITFFSTVDSKVYTRTSTKDVTFARNEVMDFGEFKTDDTFWHTPQYTFVDLGLSVMWATCNVGATALEGIGNYYAWGEIAPKSYYHWSTYKYCFEGVDNSTSTKNLTKYCPTSNYGYSGYTDSKTVLEFEDDAARTNWGGTWRTPSPDEIWELINNCDCSGEENGWIFTGRGKFSSNSIFLPFSGIMEGTELDGPTGGTYLSNSISDSRCTNNICLKITNYGETFISYNMPRNYGQVLRPVCK